MSPLNYTPDAEINVHHEGALRLICAPFKSHESGLPEWVKNSSDAYVVAEREEEHRVVVILITDSQDPSKRSIACLDFVGMRVKKLEESFRHWMDPDAARQAGSDAIVQGGHGNGGKCYLTQMFKDRGELITVRASRKCHYGVPGGSLRFGYVPDPAQGRDVSVGDLAETLSDALTVVGVDLKDLPPDAHAALEVSDGFTLIAGFAPRHFEDKIPVDQVLETLRDHQQMRTSLELCDVYLVANGETLNDGVPIELPEITPIPGEEEPRRYEIPVSIKHPVTGDWISTIDGGHLPKGELVLRTSDKNLIRARRRHRHVISFKTEAGYIGHVPVRALSTTSPYRDKIYGECYLEAAGVYKKNERQRLAESPLTEALEHFISQKVEKLASEFERRDRRKYKREVRDGVAEINRALDQWKNKFLTESSYGWGPGKEDDPEPPLPRGKAASISVRLSYAKAGVGVGVRPTVKFYNAAGDRIRVDDYEWVSEDTNVAWVSLDDRMVWTFQDGTTNIYAVANGVTSNRVSLEVVDVQKIEVDPPELEVVHGGRSSFTARCTLRDGSIAEDVALIWMEDDPGIARVNSMGMVFGVGVGETNVTPGDDRCFAEEKGRIKVNERLPHGDDPEKKGRGGFPLILVSGGFDRDPVTDEAVDFGTDYPPVTQRPEDADRGIYWINSNSPLAQLYLDDQAGYGYESLAWRLYHVERLIDVLVDIMMRGRVEDLDSDLWNYERGSLSAEIQQHIRTDLQGFIQEGALPMEDGPDD